MTAKKDRSSPTWRSVSAVTLLDYEVDDELWHVRALTPKEANPVVA
nr:hypothetical protein [Providencia sneebia]